MICLSNGHIFSEDTYQNHVPVRSDRWSSFINDWDVDEVLFVSAYPAEAIMRVDLTHIFFDNAMNLE